MRAGQGPTRRALFTAGATGAAMAALPSPARAAGAPRTAPAATGRPRAASYRAEYHFTAPDQWKNDPQRPLWIDGEYHYYYLYNPDYIAGGTRAGTVWRLATSTDLVTFRDRGTAIPKDTTPAGDVWSGCAVLDTENTAGFGRGAVVVLATQEPVEGADSQAQYLWYSTDRGRTFRPYGDGATPVLPNPGVKDFRDPKIVRDEARGRWVMVLAEGTKVGFYLSHDLRKWTYASGFVREGLGVLECPDLFRLEGPDGTAVWVLGVSANGKPRGLPNTYAYWTGAFDGTAFTADAHEPQWLDHGFDWYGAVTFDRHRPDGSPDPKVRYALAWMNNWDYPDNTPTLDTDGFNGTDSIVREITLRQDAAGVRYLASAPVSALASHASRTVDHGDLRVDGTLPLPATTTAYELTTEITWSGPLTGAGVQLRRSGDGTRHIDAGVYERTAFVNRRNCANPDTSGKHQESRSPFDPAGRRVRMRVLVDRTTVEVFFDDGRHSHAMEAFPYLVDTGLSLFTIGGPAEFRGTVVREFGRA